jgi:MiaB/RimO family radical SAM methylthiotransferase
VAPLKLASGCDRRCTFCAIPSFRGAFVSRPPNDIVAEAEWLADRGVSELLLVSENSTSYGKDLGDLQALERLLPRLAAIGGVQRVRVSYLQPAEVRPTLLDAIASTEGVAAYYDISFQHAAEPLLRRMRRFGGTDRFLELIAAIRERTPDAGIRSNFIVGFPGESDADAAELERFLTEARLDAVGIFGYSDEDGTEAASFADKVADDVIAARVARLTALAEELTAQRAEDRIGQPVEVLVEAVEGEVVEGRGEHQAPEVDGSVLVRGAAGRMIGGMVSALVVGSDGVDLLAEPR